MTRKSPNKHVVKTHVRKDGKTHVKSYVRGRGMHMGHHIAKPTLNKPEGYTVTLIYPDKTREKQEVIATTYQHAVDEAFKNKVDVRLPEEIVVTDPSLREVVHWAGTHAQKYGKIAAQKAVEYGKRGANVAIDISDKGVSNYTREYLKSGANDYRATKLIEQAYSPNRGVSVLARSKLQKEYPDVYRTMDFAR